MSPTSSRKIVPLIGLLELADLLLGRAGERALLVTEQLGFDQVVRDRRAVDLHEPLAAPQTVAVDGARHEFLAGAALAEQSTVALVGAARWIASVTFFSDGLSPTIWCRTSTARLSDRFSSARRLRSSALRIVTSTRSLASGFSMKSNAPSFVASTAVVTVAVTRDHDDRQRLVDGAQALQRLEAVHAGHLDVEEHEIGRLALGEREPVLARCGSEELVAFVFEDHPQRIADGGLVVDDQDARFHRRVEGAGRWSRSPARAQGWTPAATCAAIVTACRSGRREACAGRLRAVQMEGEHVARGARPG